MPHSAQRLLLWLCGVLVVALTMSRHWVICTHEDGEAHLEVNHDQGSHEHECECGHHGLDATVTCYSAEGACDAPTDSDCEHPHSGGTDPHDSCSHIDLLVEVGPQQQPDSVDLPLQLAFELPSRDGLAANWRLVRRPSLPPPATGPPRPRRYLSLRATTVLLI